MKNRNQNQKKKIKYNKNKKIRDISLNKNISKRIV